MQKKIYLFTAILIYAFAEFANAHPLGNFSVNQFAQIEVEKSQVKIRSILDMAEIPTFQASHTIDTDKDGALSQAELDVYAERISPDYIANMQVSVDGQLMELRPTAKEIYLEEGSGNLPILKIKWVLVGDLPNSETAVRRLKFENKNYLERIGWNEIVINRVGAINVFDSNAFGSGISDELKIFPSESLSAPLAERTAEFSFTSNSLPANAKALQNRDGQTSAPIEKDKFAELINVKEITFPIALAGLLLAFGFGAAHAMSPGHGKTVVGAYLVGSRGTVKHAVFLGLTVTMTHTISVFALGIVALFASNYILPERLMPFFSFVSGLLVFVIGLMLFKDRLFAAFGWKTNNQHSHSHEHDSHALEDEYNPTSDGLTHTHGGSTHTHTPPKDVTWSSLLGLGISGGLIPCPSALVLMLSAINLGRIGYGIILTFVFSVGLATTLTAIGIAFLYVGKFFSNPKISKSPIFKALPVFSAFVITCVGAVICYNSLI